MDSELIQTECRLMEKMHVTAGWGSGLTRNAPALR